MSRRPLFPTRRIAHCPSADRNPSSAFVKAFATTRRPPVPSALIVKIFWIPSTSDTKVRLFPSHYHAGRNVRESAAHDAHGELRRVGRKDKTLDARAPRRIDDVRRAVSLHPRGPPL